MGQKRAIGRASARGLDRGIGYSNDRGKVVRSWTKRLGAKLALRSETWSRGLTGSRGPMSFSCTVLWTSRAKRAPSGAGRAAQRVSAAALSLEGLRTAVLAGVSASTLLQWSLSAVGRALAEAAVEPNVSCQRPRARAASRTSAAASATPAWAAADAKGVSSARRSVATSSSNHRGRTSSSAGQYGASCQRGRGRVRRVSCWVGVARRPAPSSGLPRLCLASLRATGLLRMVRCEARPFEQAFLQCGLPLGVTSRPGSRGTLSSTAAALASGARDRVRPTTGHAVTMSLQIFPYVSAR